MWACFLHGVDWGRGRRARRWEHGRGGTTCGQGAAVCPSSSPTPLRRARWSCAVVGRSSRERRDGVDRRGEEDGWGGVGSRGRGVRDEAALQVLSGIRSGDEEEVKRWLRRVTTTAGMDRALKALVQKGWVEVAEDGLCHLLAGGMRSSRETMATLLSMYPRDIDSVLRVLLRCRSARTDGLVPKVFYYQLLDGIRSYATATTIVAAIRDEYGSLNRNTLQILLGKAAEEGNSEAALQVLEDMTYSRFRLDGQIYLRLVRAFQKSGLPRSDAVEQCLNALATRRLLDVSLGVAAAAAHVKDREPGLAEIAVRKCPFSPCNKLHAVLIAGRGQRGDIAGAEQAVKELETAGVRPDVEVLNALMKAYADDGDIHGVRETYDEIRRSQYVRPSQKTFGILMAAFRRVGDLSGCEAALSAMEQNLVTPNRVTYNMLLKAYAEVEDEQGLDDCLFRMLRHGLEPDKSTYGILVDSYGKLGNAAKGEKCFRRMLRKRIRPDTIVCTSLLDLRIRDDRLDDAIDVVVKLMPRLRARPDSTTYHMLIRALLHENRREDAINIAKAAQDNGFNIVVHPKQTRRGPRDRS